MGFVFGNKSIPKSIFHLGEILGKSSGKTSGKFFTMENYSKGGASEPRSLNLKIL